jgi:ribonuclease VapC
MSWRCGDWIESEKSDCIGALLATSVLDASAVVAYIKQEPGAELACEAISLGATINVANWAEVLTSVVRRGGSLAQFYERLNAAGVLGPEGLLSVEAVLAEDADTAARLYTATSAGGLSLADRLCCATGIRLRLPIYTADSAWARISIAGADVRLIR